MSSDDQLPSKTPQNLKEVELVRIENEFAKIVKELIGTKSDIKAEISSINFDPCADRTTFDDNGTIEMKVKFYRNTNVSDFYGKL